MMRGRLDFILSVGALTLGFFAPFWPFIVAGVIGAAVSAHPFVALFAAFLYDMLFGAWPAFPTIPMPLTIAATLLVLLIHVSKRYFRTR